MTIIGVACLASSKIFSEATHTSFSLLSQRGLTLFTISLDPAVIAALIGLAGVIVGALLGGAFAIYQLRYQIRRNAALEQQRQQEQFRHEQEMLRLQEDLKRQAREEQQQEAEAEAAQTAMQRAKTRAERLTAYRQALHTDPRVARLQILDMNRPLEVVDIYVGLRVHQETKPGYELDPALRDADKQHDPNVFLQAHQQRLEQRASTALAPEEAIRTYKRCVLVGDPGAGKSTLLKHLALLSVDQRQTGLPDLPIHIELQAFASSGYRDLLEFAAAVWEERYGFPKAEALDAIQTQLHDGHALLLLDALDETVTGNIRAQAEESYLQVSKLITDLATRYPQAPIVVTVRKASYHQRTRLAGFTELEVLDFRPEDVKQFVQYWFDCHPDPQKRGNAADLIAKLERMPRMQALAANPLLLSLIVIVYEDQLDLPERRAELYKQCVDTLLTKWDASRNIRRLRAFKPEHKRHLLEEVAWHFHSQGQRYFPERELLGVIAAFLPAIGLQAEHNGQVLGEIVAENGLLKEQAHGWYGFLHLTLQEYFVAQYAVDHHQMETLLHWRDNPWWEEVLFLYAGRISDASPLLQHLLETTASEGWQYDLFHADLILAGRCLAAYPTIRQDPSLREEIIARLFQLLGKARYSLTQEQVASALAEIGGHSVNSQLVALLSDEKLDPTARWSIADTLGALGERSVAPQLVALLSDKQLHSYVHWSIADTLGALGERSIAPQLVTIISDEQLDPAVRGKIASTLGALGERSIAPQLVVLLANEHLHPYVRGKIADTLGALGERSIVPQLMALLSDEQLHPYVRGSIADTLGILGERSIVPQLVNILSDERLNPSVRGKVADTLGTLGERSVVLQLVASLSNKQLDPVVRGSIAATLGTLGERSVVPQLVVLLSDEQLDPVVRGSIAATLGTLGERPVVPQLVALLSDEQLDSYVRGSIAATLGTLGERSVVPQLMVLLSDEQLDPAVRGKIVETLGALGERSIVMQLVALLSNQQLHSYVRWSIAEALGTLGERSIVMQLVALLSDEQLDYYVRGSIAETLGTLGERSVAPHLVTLLSNKQLDSYVRGKIATALGTLGERTFPAAVQLDPAVRGKIATALRTLGERSIVPQLVALPSDEQLDSYVRGGITDTLGTLGERSVAPQLVALLSDEQLDPAVRGSIAATLGTLVADEKIVQALASLVLTSDIADSIHRTLWTLSRQIACRIVVTYGPTAKKIEVVKLPSI